MKPILKSLAGVTGGLLLSLGALADTTEDAKAEALFEAVFNENLDRSPVFQTYLGMKTNYDQWDDLSPEHEREGYAQTRDHLTRLQAIDKSKLSADVALSYRLLEDDLKQDIEFEQWRLHNYPVNQMFGTHSMVPSFLINQHRVDTVEDAQAYIGRINGVPKLMIQLTANLEERAKAGIIAPKFVFPYVISDSENLLKGAPFTKGEDSPLMADLRKKVNALDTDDKTKAKLIKDGEKALKKNLKAGYTHLISYLKKLEKKADTRDGAWKLPKGGEFYNAALRKTTTTELTAEEIHNIGLKEVARIHGEMKAIMKQVKFEGSLQDFFVFMREDDQFYYPNTEAGKQRYLDEATAMIDNMKGRLDELFITKPKADLIVKAVEPFREKSAGKAFYQRPAPNGSRPGIYYANLYDMKSMPTYQMEALAYHEGIPGHHMQLAIATELTGVPKFRKFGHYTAYSEGWGLYTEYLPKEMGLYEDPYSDFGRLAMELWRAARLVVDTGLHYKKWTREQAIDYLVTNTPNPEADCVKAIERYIVMPSQATAYKIGMIKILELREKAKAEMGDRFDIRQYHDLVLTSGPVPLTVLEERVNQWIAGASK
ncbi:DUF885 domain-containing protein [Simiduia agarivorans]|uniref:Lipoprotein n=1 Tax=Simiduia agarivorans (strain DSM 21679 / JCM 13881 / BCRC 17597 / SA1) TaxID=1117647 RepID=K4KL97_SIMAS|nr:DUF885 domain-containing protein [Simiduia agarivorans]AFU98828.1 hypothetical protein M5M_08195 [Simiduia agarivorans SA1 = DSM 21679]